MAKNKKGKNVVVPVMGQKEVPAKTGWKGIGENIRSLAMEPLTLLDWILFLVIGTFCFLIYQQADITHTGGSSFAYLNGHILDFYEYNKKYMGVNNYYPSTYILFAIWNIPIKLMNLYSVPTMGVSMGVRMWFKLLPTVLFIASAFLVYKIAISMGMKEAKSKLCAYLFLTLPVAFFSQFIFGQYDVFNLFFMLLGICFYLRDDMPKFALLFGVAITFKYFALLFFLPMLLLKEKRLSKLILFGMLALTPIAAETLIYIGSAAFQSGVLAFGEGKAAYVFGFRTNIYGHTEIIYNIFFYMICLAYAYLKVPSDRNSMIKYMLFLSNVVAFICFGASMWHPQWLILAAPFLVLSTMMHKRPDFFLFLDMICMLFFTIFVVNSWYNHVDQQLLRAGLLSPITKDILKTPLYMKDILVLKDEAIAYSIFSSILLINVIFKHPRFCADDFNEPLPKLRAIVRARFLVGVSIFVIPSLISLGALYYLPTVVYETPSESIEQLVRLDPGQECAQIYTPDEDYKLSSVEVLFATYMQETQSTIRLTVMEEETGTILHRMTIDSSPLKDNTYEKIKLPNIPVQKDHEYAFVFETTDAQGDLAAIWVSMEDYSDKGNYAMVNGEKQEFNLMMNFYGKRK